MSEVVFSTAPATPVVPFIGAADAGLDNARIHELNRRAEDVNARLKQTARERLLLSAEQWITIRALGGPTGDRIGNAAKFRGIENKTELVYLDAVELVEGGEPYGKLPRKTPAQKKVRKDRYNHISRLAKLFAALDKLLSNETFRDDPVRVADWIEANGSLDGVVRAAKEGAEQESFDQTYDDSPILAALSGRQAFEIPAPQELIAAEPAPAMLMRVGEKLRLVQLRALSPDVLRLLSRFVPTTEENLPTELNFLGRLFQLSTIFPPSASSEDRRPADGDAGEGLKLPSFPMIFWDGVHFSLAPSRRRASIVVQARPSGSLKLPPATHDEPLHFATPDLKRAQDELAPVEARRAYESAHVVTVDDSAHVEIVGAAARLKLRLLPLSKFGSSSITSQYTVRVGAQYQPKAEAELPLTLADDLRRFAGRISGSKHVVKVASKMGTLSLQLGEAEPMQLKAAGKGQSSISVRADDFATAVKAMLDLGGLERLSVKCDPKGMLEIGAATDAGEFSTFIPSTLQGEPGNPRDTSLLDRIERSRN